MKVAIQSLRSAMGNEIMLFVADTTGNSWLRLAAQVFTNFALDKAERKLVGSFNSTGSGNRSAEGTGVETPAEPKIQSPAFSQSDVTTFSGRARAYRAMADTLRKHEVDTVWFDAAADLNDSFDRIIPGMAMRFYQTRSLMNELGQALFSKNLETFNQLLDGTFDGPRRAAELDSKLVEIEQREVTRWLDGQTLSTRQTRGITNSTGPSGVWAMRNRAFEHALTANQASWIEQVPAGDVAHAVEEGRNSMEDFYRAAFFGE